MKALAGVRTGGVDTSSDCVPTSTDLTLHVPDSFTTGLVTAIASHCRFFQLLKDSCSFPIVDIQECHLIQ